jgi:hypothetical protein
MVILKLSLFHQLYCELQILILSGSVGLVCSLHRQLERNLSWLPELGDDENRLVWNAFLLSEGFTSVCLGDLWTVPQKVERVVSCCSNNAMGIWAKIKGKDARFKNPNAIGQVVPGLK